MWTTNLSEQLHSASNQTDLGTEPTAQEPTPKSSPFSQWDKFPTGTTETRSSYVITNTGERRGQVGLHITLWPIPLLWWGRHLYGTWEEKSTVTGGGGCIFCHCSSLKVTPHSQGLREELTLHCTKNITVLTMTILRNTVIHNTHKDFKTRNTGICFSFKIQIHFWCSLFKSKTL